MSFCEMSTNAGQKIRESLTNIKGRLTVGAPLFRLSWFRTGGPADLLFEPTDEKDLAGFLRQLPSHIPVTVIGVGSNLLVRDSGVRGVVIRLGRAFSDIEARGDLVKAGGGAMDAHVAKAAQKAGIGGLEFLIGIPGTLGGAVFMNAGAYNQELRDCLIHARAVDRLGALHEIDPTQYEFSYRSSGLPEDWIITSVNLKGTIDECADIEKKMTQIMATRSDSQPIGTRTGGSTFKNPDPLVSNDRSAWQLIDEAGMRGARVGDAQVSEKHCNFLINHGHASAKDIEDLGNLVRESVLEKLGVELHWEIKIIGEKGGYHDNALL
ncbi:UDP-N-acetylmuramate dehydrogenase [Temperatibacter marinus]|uniref:UDP-N-acetylenolpyruvoylglucosamine reductase n=1 Tax=Temperatibacter marinus TaxID=1456591 RepID=A0AA52H7Z7_9PROT|nr:UDP-N-acetylmuramate dehydrogenase [Temperatibacter marinus]WND01596.1 UDP-N-acetylmuramate dehydrogenase [Temperatibacter marinus]